MRESEHHVALDPRQIRDASEEYRLCTLQLAMVALKQNIGLPDWWGVLAAMVSGGWLAELFRAERKKERK